MEVVDSVEQVCRAFFALLSRWTGLVLFLVFGRRISLFNSSTSRDRSTGFRGHEVKIQQRRRFRPTESAIQITIHYSQSAAERLGLAFFHRFFVTEIAFAFILFCTLLFVFCCIPSPYSIFFRAVQWREAFTAA